MLTLIRQSYRRLRPWLFAAAVVFVLASIVEAGHSHGVFSAADDHCLLCQHSVSFDQAPLKTIALFVLVLLAVFVVTPLPSWVPRSTVNPAPIRAPPLFLHTR